MYTETPATAVTYATEATSLETLAVVATAEPVSLKDNAQTGSKPQILDDLVIEEVSIDGMCGVY